MLRKDPTLTSNKGKDNTYGVFVHSGDGSGIYRKEDAIKVYNRQWQAQQCADRLNETNDVHVVRTMEYIVR